MVALCLHLRVETGLDWMILVTFFSVSGLVQAMKTWFFQSTTCILRFFGAQLLQRACEAQRCRGAFTAGPACEATQKASGWQYCQTKSNLARLHRENIMFVIIKKHSMQLPSPHHRTLWSFYVTDDCSLLTRTCYCVLNMSFGCMSSLIRFPSNHWMH